MIYLDNAATSRFKPPSVLKAATDAIANSTNAARSSGKEAFAVAERIAETRNVLQALVGGKNHAVAFSQNCTTALNLAVLGSVERGWHVVTTALEHNSVLRPLFELKRRGIIRLTVLRPEQNGKISPQALANALRSETAMVVVGGTSNVTGVSQDLFTLCHVVKSNLPGALFVCDLAQTVGHELVDVGKIGADMAAFPMHKGLHGVQGCGVLVFDKSRPPRPVVFGGTGTESHLLTQPRTIPEGLEAGTLNLPAVLSAYYAVEWWVNGFAEHTQKVAALCKKLHDDLSKIRGVRLYSAPNASGIVAFDVGGTDSTLASDLLGEKGFVVRGGLHCAPLAHDFLGTTECGLVRASVAMDNTESQIDEFCQAVADCAKKGA